MRIKFPLYLQITFILLLNLSLLLATVITIVSTRFQWGWEALIYSPISLKMKEIAFIIHQQTELLPRQSWDKALQDFGKFYGVKLYLFDMHGHQIAGESVLVPGKIMQRISRPLFFPGFLTDKPGKPPKIMAPGRPQPKFPESMPPPLLYQHEPPPQGKFPNTFLPPKLLTAPPLFLALGPSPDRFVIHTSQPNRFWIGVMIPLKSIRGPGTLLATTENLWQTGLIFDFIYLFIFAGGIFLLSIIVWWPFVYSMTAALDKLTQAAEKIAEGKFGTAISIKRHDEIGRLGQSINTMSERLQMYINGQKRFLSDIAHELCSPIARLQIATELLDSTDQASRNNATKDIREDVELMSSLINELLAFSKAGILGKEIELTTISIPELVQSVAAKFPAQNNILLDIQPQLFCCGNRMLLQRALENILRNALRYAGDYGPIAIKAARKDKDIVITVTDSGPGVSTEELKFLGQPFYRPERSRSRSSGGIGLGLAIVKTCIEACNGVLYIKNKQPSGLEIEIVLQTSEAESLPKI